MSFEIVQGDITKVGAEVVVNSANRGLYPGGGVCGAIHRAAGPDLALDCRRIGYCKTGGMVVTKGYNLSKFVAHVTGPVWEGGKNGEPLYLRLCYERPLRWALGHNIESIAFPSISTGVYRYPVNLAAAIAVQSIRNMIDDSPIRVLMVCFSEADLIAYQKADAEFLSGSRAGA